MGWLGWSEEQTLRTSIPAIELAFEGRVEMLKACFHVPPPPEPDEPPAAPTGAEIFATVRSAVNR